MFFATPNVWLDESIGYSLQAIGFCALIILVKEHSGRFRTFRLYRFVAWLGVYSYGIYLWHSLALSPGDVVTRYLLNHGMPALLVFPLGLGFQMIFAVGIGYVMTHAIEFPLLRIRDRFVPANKRPSATTPGADLKSAA
jgi:peptidoglycan/LPS O-acetylase OafA/YrhL